MPAGAEPAAGCGGDKMAAETVELHKLKVAAAAPLLTGALRLGHRILHAEGFAILGPWLPTPPGALRSRGCRR